MNFDHLSFWIGFLAASILWWLVSRFRQNLPYFLEQIRHFLDRLRLEKLAGVENRLRKETIHLAQYQHLAANLFSLDEILIEPMLLAPPIETEAGSSDRENPSITRRIFPYIPDWPEILAPYRVPRVTSLEIIQSRRHIAIIGQPGSGKSTALFHLACEINRNQRESAPSSLAILLHAFDLHLEEGVEEDPINNIINYYTNRVGGFNANKLFELLKFYHQDDHRKLIFLIDGLDELPPDKFTECVNYLNSLISSYPRSQTVLTASSNYLDGLIGIGFYPLSIASWSHKQLSNFAVKWSEAWNVQLTPELKKSSAYQEPDQTLLNSWISNETAYLNPLELTMRIWGAYAGDLRGSIPSEIIENHITRYLPNQAFIHALESIAHTMVQGNSYCLPLRDIEKSLAGHKEISSEQTGAKGEEKGILPQPPSRPWFFGEKFVKGESRAIGEQIVLSLISGGVFTIRGDDFISFSSPIFFGFLSGRKIKADEANQLLDNHLTWQAALETLHYASSIQEDNTWINRLIEDPRAPTYNHLMLAARWLRDAPSKLPWRTQLMRTLVNLLQNDFSPFSMRVKIIAAFYVSRDPSITKLFTHLLSSQSPSVRRAALIGCGNLNDPSLINDILLRIGDPVEEVRLTACLALSTVPSETATDALVEILMSSDEELRQAVAESLANDDQIGHKLLQEATTTDDILTRRSAVLGIAQIQQSWAKKLLEKIAIEDSQWVVRNTAAHALENLQRSHQYIPRPLPTASEVPWLLRFAGNLGLGILPGSDAFDILLTALNSGSEEEQEAALLYLRHNPSDDVIKAIYQLLYGKRVTIQEPAYYALWWINLCGYNLPNPAQYGYPQ